jgi:hypothetical protein
VLLHLAMPLVVLLALLLLELLLPALVAAVMHRRAAARLSMRNRLASIAMIVLFFFLPSVLKTVSGLFVCIPLDQPASAPYSANAVGSFWVYDVDTSCFSPGWHAALSLGLGVPQFALLCVGLPLVIVCITSINRGRLSEPVFVRHWGFLTRPYKSSRCWWEAVLVCETTALVAVSAFGVNIGAFYQTIAMTAVLLLIMHLLQVCRPFADAQSGRCMLQGVQCLLLTTFIGLTFLRVGSTYPSQTYGLVM